jgi:hypothetical protein
VCCGSGVRAALKGRRRIGARRQGRCAGTRAGPRSWPSEIQEDGVSEFDDLEKKAQAYAGEHPEQADKAINEVTGIAERDSDHQHDEQIDRAVDAAEQHLSQDEQGTQN